MNVEVTDQDMADMLRRTLEEIQELKNSNESEYHVLKTGILCVKLNLNEDDLEKMYKLKVSEGTVEP
jgi:hypothetical protein